MIKKLLQRLIGQSPRSGKPSLGKRRLVAASEHGIDPNLVDERALSVVKTLQDRGFEAYIVGGAVRDLLLGLRPKDFDVATNATPEEVKSLFRRAFIIGRRFRIVHVVFGRGREHEVIEVSTFRAYMDPGAAEQVSGNERTSKQALAGMTHAVDASGRVLRDNVWGPQDEDAARRDFTVNAMYYDPRSQQVVDYHGGIEDARKRRLRLIGDPATRYREDPVRIVRAVRFAAKLAGLGFEFDSKTAAPLTRLKSLLADIPQSRMFDEMLKLLQTGHAQASIAQLRKLGLAQGLYPLLDLVVERADQPFVSAALQDTDRRVGEGKPVAPSFLLACVLWSDVREAWGRLQAQQATFPALQQAIDEVFDQRVGDVSGRGKLGADMREIWMMQPRFDKRTGSGPFTLVEQARFRAGFDFMRLRADVGEIDVTLADWWQEFSLADDATREDLLQQVRPAPQRRKRRSDNSRQEGSSDEGTAIPQESAQSENDGSGPGAGRRSGGRHRRGRRGGRGGGGSAGGTGAGTPPDSP
jgi:poly(A) polymerase